MRVKLLGKAESADLAAQPLTYGPVGLSAADGPVPAGYQRLTRSRLLVAADFDRAGEELMTWQVQSRSGLRVSASASRAQSDAVVRMHLGVGRASIHVRCRVVQVWDEADRQGFAYGTLPGHPESGEEAFVLHRRPDGHVEFVITAVSRPASALARLAGPITSRAQWWMTNRYLHALD